jgi:outer membrane protein OmpA-like peptidoglycan-associated protein
MNVTLGLCRISLLAAAVIAAGCASTPRMSSEVSALQGQLQNMRADPRIAPHAAVELREAEQAVQVLIDQRRMPPKDFDQNLYLAGRLVNIARAEGLARHATAVGQTLDSEREVMLLAARTAEADRARLQAERERLRADEAQRSNQRARSDAELANRDASRAQRDASWAHRDAEQARLQASNERLAAERGQREADLARGEAADARLQANSAREALRLLQTELADLQARQTERGLVVTVGDVLFEVDRAELRGGAQRELDKLARALHDHPGLDLIIEGHTDSTGTAAHNQDLSERRAASVRHYLIAQGIGRDRSRSLGLGQDHPVANNGNASGRQQNRRVEIVIQQAEAPRVSEVDRD